MAHLQIHRRVIPHAFAALWLAALVGLVFAAPLTWLVREWRDNPYYEHGPIVPLIALGLAGFSVPRLTHRPRAGQSLGLALVVAGLGLRMVGAAAGSDLLGVAALVVVLAGFAAWWLGWAGLRALRFPIGYLLLAIPLPVMDDLGFYFQRLSTAATTLVVQRLGVPATYQGAEVSLPAASFFVGVQCSGLYSTVSLTVLGLLFLRMLDLPSWWRRALLVAAIPLVALTANVFRLSSLLAIAHWQSGEAAMAFYHNLGDVVFWLLAMGLFFAIGKGLEWTPTGTAS